MAISRSSFYAPPADKPDDTKIVVEMKAIADEFEAYGYRRMSAELRQRGLVVNAKKVRRLMRENDLNPRHRRRYVATTDSDHDHPIFPNRAKKLVSDGPNQLWVAAAMFRLSRGGPQNSNSRVSVLVSEGNCSQTDEHRFSRPRAKRALDQSLEEQQLT